MVATACSVGPPAPDPIVFVHGWLGRPDQWSAMVERFADDGWPDDRLVVWAYDSGLDNLTIAGLLAEEVDRVLEATGASKVDLVTHSMGALPSRWFVKHLDGAARVDAWVSIAGPNGGLAIDDCPNASCEDMHPDSPFLAALNEGDPTPGDVRYATWASSCDTVVEPASTELEGAENTRTPCLDHVGIIEDGGVYAGVRDFVSG